MSDDFISYGLTVEVGGMGLVDVLDPSYEENFVVMNVVYLSDKGNVMFKVAYQLTAEQAEQKGYELIKQAKLAKAATVMHKAQKKKL